MGYLLNSLANLPVDSDVKFYVFVINGRWRDELYNVVEENFAAIARSIGSNAVIARGLDPAEFYGEIERKYLGPDHERLWDLLPALLITDAHPDAIHDKSLRLIVPLKDAEARFGGWAQFFSALSEFVTGRSQEFLDRFQKKEDVIDTFNRLVEIKPGAFGVSLNVNELITWFRDRSSSAQLGS